MRLRSRDYRDRPRVDPRYFTGLEGYDQRIMTAGLRKAKEIVSQEPLAEWAGEELFPGVDVQTDGQIQDYIRRTHTTVCHLAGTVRMAPSTTRRRRLTPSCRSHRPARTPQ
ncbi:choline dehydrogenase-like flavoprotein [Arthrobacter sp. UYNi723]